MKTVCWFAGAILAAAPATASEPLSEDQIAAVKRGVLALFRDPSSATFRDIVAGPVSPKGVRSVCGYVNARNGLDAYTGFRPFWGALGGQSGRHVFLGVEISSPDRSAVRRLIAVCKDVGAPL